MISEIINNNPNTQKLYYSNFFHQDEYRKNICRFIISTRLISLYFLWKKRKEINKPRMKTYDKLGNFLPLRTFITFTNFGNLLALIWFSFNHTNSGRLYVTIYNILFIITFGFWAVIYPKLTQTSNQKLHTLKQKSGPIFFYFFGIFTTTNILNE